MYGICFFHDTGKPSTTTWHKYFCCYEEEDVGDTVLLPAPLQQLALSISSNAISSWFPASYLGAQANTDHPAIGYCY